MNGNKTVEHKIPIESIEAITDPNYKINKEKLEKYFKSFDSVYGWFNINSAKSLLWLDFIQKKEFIEGNLFEIGVFLGKSAILFGLLTNQDKERFGVCDHFKAGERLNIPQKEIFFRNLNDYFDSLNFIDVHDKLSHKLSLEECKGCRLFHIDGGHTFQYLTTDLNLAERGIIDKGLIIIDDFFNVRCPEVTEGVYNHLKEKETLSPLLITFGKLVLCKRSMYSWYFEKLNTEKWKDYINDEKVDLMKTKMANHDILTFTRK